MHKTSIALAACALVASVGLVRGNTIQPIIENVVGGSGSYTYTIDIELTPNNYLLDFSAPVAITHPTSVTILDFGQVTGTVNILNLGGLAGANVTGVGDWQWSYQSIGANLPNASSAAGEFKLLGTNGLSATAPDTSLSNVTLKYVGSGLSTSAFAQRSLIQIEVTTDMAPGPILNSVDTDGNPITNVQQVDTYSLSTFGVPEPATLSVALLGCVGLLLRRRRA